MMLKKIDIKIIYFIEEKNSSIFLDEVYQIFLDWTLIKKNFPIKNYFLKLNDSQDFDRY